MKRHERQPIADMAIAPTAKRLERRVCRADFASLDAMRSLNLCDLRACSPEPISGPGTAGFR